MRDKYKQTFELSTNVALAGNEKYMKRSLNKPDVRIKKQPFLF